MALVEFEVSKLKFEKAVYGSDLIKGLRGFAINKFYRFVRLFIRLYSWGKEYI